MSRALAREVIVPSSLSSCNSREDAKSEVPKVKFLNVTFGVLGHSLPKLICIGNSVNIAARMEQISKAGVVRVTKYFFYDLMKDEDEHHEDFHDLFRCETLHKKNMGEIETYLFSFHDEKE